MLPLPPSHAKLSVNTTGDVIDVESDDRDAAPEL
jgi:hypothetical protein